MIAKVLERVMRLTAYRYAVAALVLLALAALYGAAALSRPDGPARAATGVRTSVTAALVACPGGEGLRLSTLAPPSAAKSAVPGKGEVVPTRGGTPLGTPAAPGTVWSKDLAKTRDSFAVRAYGHLAAGLEVEQTTHWPSGGDRGLAGVRCAAPNADQWFTGPGPDAAERLDLYLTNLEAQPASVDVTALSGEGPLDTTDGRGTLVEPYSTRIVRIGKQPEGLGDIVAAAREIAIRVRSTSGRVAASLRVRSAAKAGIDWLPPAPAPATALVLPGVPGGAGQRQLLVAVPGGDDAQVRIRAITARGAFTPQGQDVLDAPAGTVTAVPLESTLAGKAAAVRITSDRPIVAGFTAQSGADVAYGTATEPLGEVGGVVADNRFESWLTLTAPDRAATVRVTPVGPDGPGAVQEIRVPAGRTAEARLAGPPGAPSFGALIALGPGSGPVHAARTLATGKGGERSFTVLPIVPAPVAQRMPPVGDSPRSLVP
ncbi:DUF5719 family protein [Actinomadura hibisca]|uniref:DUF5719 family protein n=1 Tax=Actinomadura hibisca TaxID=68565 RepID=UPI000AEEF651|nr:DUF5719 family protein [Actinomadura hibisca]